MTNSTTTPRIKPRAIGAIIDQPTDEERDVVLNQFFADQRRIRDERAAAVEAALPALGRLCEVLRGRSGQPYKVRALLYSLWNGQPTSLSEVLGLDWDIRKDFCAVILAFGYDSGEGLPPQLRSANDAPDFFYDAITAALKEAGQYEWFLEEFKESGAA